MRELRVKARLGILGDKFGAESPWLGCLGLLTKLHRAMNPCIHGAIYPKLALLVVHYDIERFLINEITSSLSQNNRERERERVS